MNSNTDLLGQALMPLINSAITAEFEKFDIEKKLSDSLLEIGKNSSKKIEISLNGGEPKDIGVQHKQFETIFNLIANNMNVMITGEAGLGKSHLLSQIAKGLDIPFHSMSVNSQTTKTDLLGFVDANGVYRFNGFVSAFRNGGMFNMDEIDAGNSNVLTVLNSALSNGFIELPNGEMVYANEKFRFACTANTVGTGGNTKYVGRNKLDMATLDRFTIVKLNIDKDLELLLMNSDKELNKAIWKMREFAEDKFNDFPITQRSAIKLKQLIDMGINTEEALDFQVFKGCSDDIRNSLLKVFNDNYFKKEKSDDLEFKSSKPKIESCTDEQCPRCKKGFLSEKTGKFGKFKGCSNYPECSYTKKIDANSSEEKDPFEF